MPKPAIDYSRLTVEQRLRLIEEVWASVVRDDPSLADLSPEKWHEVERRVAAHERDPRSSVPWEVVRADLLRAITTGR